MLENHMENEIVFYLLNVFSAKAATFCESLLNMEPGSEL
jgi:hypothetical protein